jgi:hypothetical protein
MYPDLLPAFTPEESNAHTHPFMRCSYRVKKPKTKNPAEAGFFASIATT